jgi:hypothetical protein
LAGTLMLALVLAKAASAHAQPSRFEDLVAAAIEEYNAGNWDEAHLLFARAHAIKPSARTFRGMGLADYERRNYVAAIAELEAALASPDKPLEKAQRESAERGLAQARLYIAVYRIRGAAAASELLVDAQRAQLSNDGLLLLNPGKHTLTVKLASGQTVEREIIAEAGARGELVFESGTAPSQTALPGTTDGPHTADAAAVDHPSAVAAHGGLLWTWVAGGATVAFAAGTVIFGRLAVDKNDEFRALSGACPGPDCRADRKADAKSTGQEFQLLTNVSLGVTGAAAVATVVLYLVESRTPDERAGVGMLMGPGYAGIGGRF